MPAYGAGPAGFVVKPQSAILADMQAQVWSTIDPAMDLSVQTPDGQFLAIYANDMGAAWELLQICYNQFNREDVEGAGADNLGDLVGVPREGESYTQVVCDVTLAAGTYAAGALVANVFGSPAQTFTNASAITSAGGVVSGVLFQSTVPGETPAVNPTTLTAITGPVTGWTTINNPLGQSQLGANQEPDALYLPRQAAEIAAEGSSSPGATAAALEELGASQSPPVTLSVTVLENTGPLQVVTGAVVLPPHSYAVVVYDDGTGWALSTAGQALIGQVIYANKPAGIATVGTVAVPVVDPVLGIQVVNYIVPTAAPLYIVMYVVPRPGIVFATLQLAIEAALVAAAVAPNLTGGIPPLGQLTPGAYVVGAQLEAVVMGVPGVFDIYGPGGIGTPIAFDIVPTPTNIKPLKPLATQVATIDVTKITINQVAGP
jgi:hypothetical protein